MSKPFTVGDEVVLMEVYPNPLTGALKPAYDTRMYGSCNSVCEGNTIFAGPSEAEDHGFPFSTVIDEKTKVGEYIAFHTADPIILELAKR